MLDSVMTAYQQIRHGLIGTLSGSDGITYEEVNFYDLGYMQTMLAHIKKELKSVEDSLSSSIKNEASTAEVNTYRNDLMKRRELLIYNMIFLLSNSFSNIENCKKIADGHTYEFMICVEGLDEYHKGNKDKAFELIEGYFKEYGSVESHYLINKVFGLLLYEKDRYEKAIPFLSYALGFVPDDEECLKVLNNCYQKSGELEKQRVISDICSLLGY